ncbi:hypothetical protein F4810DRAFT_710984 [Camillea tinctor]|nr:hypothetical protein F4810DRAFT_710984 [Camillea tinctor]
MSTASASPPLPALPSAPLTPLPLSLPGIRTTLQPPLSRRGHGPGLILVLPDCGAPGTTTALGQQKQQQQQGEGAEKEEEEEKEEGEDSPAATLEPPPQKKWAEEGYAVVQLVFSGTVGGEGEGKEGEETKGGEGLDVAGALDAAVEALRKLEECDGVEKGVGVIVFGTPSLYPPPFTPLLQTAFSNPLRHLSCSISFSPAWALGSASQPALLHLPSATPWSPAAYPHTQAHRYPSPFSPLPWDRDFRYASACLAHTRSLAFLKPLLGGPYFDLEGVWEEHTGYEFADRSVERTMSTMVDEPYVNHVPTLAGGIGRAALTAFYRERFIFANPPDAALELVSRTVGIDRVVDEFVFRLTHDRVVDWLLPGIPPTHKPLRLPFTAVVCLRGDRLYHEHISWDQGTALRQLGLLPEYLPFPYPIPHRLAPVPAPATTSSSPATITTSPPAPLPPAAPPNDDDDEKEEGGEQEQGKGKGEPRKILEYRVPVAGAETAAKLADGAGSAVPSNAMFGFGVREV